MLHPGQWHCFPFCSKTEVQIGHVVDSILYPVSISSPVFLMAASLSMVAAGISLSEERISRNKNEDRCENYTFQKLCEALRT